LYSGLDDIAPNRRDARHFPLGQLLEQLAGRLPFYLKQVVGQFGYGETTISPVVLAGWYLLIAALVVAALGPAGWRGRLAAGGLGGRRGGGGAGGAQHRPAAGAGGVLPAPGRLVLARPVRDAGARRGGAGRRGGRPVRGPAQRARQAHPVRAGAGRRDGPAAPV